MIGLNEKIEKFYSRNIIDQDIDERALSFEGDPNNLEELLTETGDDDNLHIGQVVVNVGGKIYLIDNNGIQELSGKPTGRGTSVFLQFNSEHESIYETHYQFHKGTTYKHTAKIAEYNSESKKTEKVNKTPLEAVKQGNIWRD